MRYRDLPIKTRERITDYYEHKYFQKRLFNETQILGEISTPLRDVSSIYLISSQLLIESLKSTKEIGYLYYTRPTY